MYFHEIFGVHSNFRQPEAAEKQEN